MKNRLFKRTVLSFLVVALSYSVPAKAEEFTKGDIEGIIREYIMENPELIIESFQAYQEKEKRKQQEALKEKLSGLKDQLAGMDVPMAGNPDGDVTIVEFYDYNCGYCKKAVGDIVKILETDKNVKVLFIDYPVLGASSQEAAKWALASAKQGKYYEYHVALMEFKGQKSEATLTSVAKSVGLDVDQLKKDAEDPAIAKTLQEFAMLARELGIRGTPAFIIGDDLSPGYIGYQGVKAGVEKARQNNE